MKKVYFISGLGADKRAFSLLDLSFCEAIFVDWIQPLKNESLCDYALRMRSQIPSAHPIVVGMSFGGMLAAEMANHDKNVTSIIIASNKSAAEFPFYLRAGKYFPLYKLISPKSIKHATLVNWAFGIREEKTKKLVSEILADTDPGFMKWAIKAILNWPEHKSTGNIRHIHGTADKVLPARFVKADELIRGGTHLITLNHPKEVSSFLKKLILE